MNNMITNMLRCLLLLIFSNAAFAQANVPHTFLPGQPARAAEVNENFDVLEAAVNQNETNIATNSADIAANAADIQALDPDVIAEIQGKLDLHETRIGHLENEVGNALDVLMTCGDYRLYGCTLATSAGGTSWEVNSFDLQRDVAILIDNAVGADSVFFAIPTYHHFYAELWIGGTANLTRTKTGDYGSVLVDDCDNPSVLLVPTGEPPSSRLVTNNGNFYRAQVDPTGQSPYGYGPIINTVDVTGQTYGLINTQEVGNIIEACTTVMDQTGMYDMYIIDLKFNITDGRFDNPWTYQ